MKMEAVVNRLAGMRRLSLRTAALGILSVLLVLFVGAVYSGTLVTVPDNHCLTYQEEGCGGGYPCLVQVGRSHGYFYWPPVDIGGDACMPSCPTAHCHSDNVPGSKEYEQYSAFLVQVQERIKTAINDGNSVGLAAVLRSSGQVTLNKDRQAIQLVSGCANDKVIAHYPLQPSLFVAVSQEYDNRANLALRVINSVKMAISAIL